MLLIVIFCHDSEVMQNAGSVQALLARELAEYEMQVEQNVLAPMTSLLEVIKIMSINEYIILFNNGFTLYSPLSHSGHSS